MQLKRLGCQAKKLFFYG